jgi:hypothetical protein
LFKGTPRAVPDNGGGGFHLSGGARPPSHSSSSSSSDDDEFSGVARGREPLVLAQLVLLVLLLLALLPLDPPLRPSRGLLLLPSLCDVTAQARGVGGSGREASTITLC